ncbi:MAG: acyltransferase family protein [Oscillospiraceae bacterium]|nr:acyltransferase family protein [Oscillospiraceae bacterium]
MRKHFIDNLRWLCILLLFPFHVFRIYNSFMEGFYVEGQDIVATTGFIVAVAPWFMPLLFVIAGVSSAYALNKRTYREYAIERVRKLLIPFLAGLLLVVPAQTFFAERFHNGFTGGYFYQYILFFTAPTDLTGYRGGFTPAHLWFILFLFVISLVALPLAAVLKKAKRKPSFERTPLWLLPLLGLLPWLMMPILNFDGMSVGMYFAYFMLGYLVLSHESLVQQLARHRFVLLTTAAFGMVLCVGAWLLQLHGMMQMPQTAMQLCFMLYGWLAVLALFGLGNRYLNFNNKVTDYLSVSAFPIYLFHQSWIVAVAYFTLMWIDSVVLQIGVILTLSVLLTYASYELFKRIPGVRFLFGIKARTSP